MRNSAGTFKIEVVASVVCRPQTSLLKILQGREFFRFDTNMTEVIRNMYLEGPDMFLAGDYSMFHYVETRDQDFYMCNDRINDLVCAHITSDSEFDAILACHDKALRVIQGSECLFEIPVPSAATALSLLSQKGTDKTFVYGTNKGELGSVLVNNSEFKNKWTVSSETSSSGINVITVCDFSRSGCRDVAVGRDDGTVEVLSFTEGDMDKPPVTTFKTRLNESIQSIEHGRVINPNYEEIVVGSFSGKIIGFSPEPATLAVPEITDRAHEKQRIAEIEADLKKRVEDTEVEVKRLQGCLQREMDKVKERPALVIPQIDVNVQFSLDAKGSHYLLSIETKCPLEYITFACDVLLEMEEVDHTQCAIMLSPPVPEAGSLFLATCRIVLPDLHRVELCVRVAEGQCGTLQIYTIPKITPRTTQLSRVSIPPLCLHERVNTLGDAELRRPMNEVKITGTFTLPEIHSWVSFCFPEVPVKLTSDDITINFRSIFTGSVVTCSYTKGSAEFRTDSITTLFTIKDYIAKQATLSKTKIHVSTAIKEQSIVHVLELLDPVLERQFQLHQQVQLVDALREIQLQEQDVSFMSPEFADILARADDIKRDYQQQPKTLESLFGVIIGLYMTKLKLKGKNPDGKEAELRTQLTHYSLANLKSFFMES
eukprot:TRINITY_DN2412_c0_g1_i2.p1 TRINITY_DN2412_c0_g1~~TRINITY_DN2412_c0_g1_i2.p1  ORF type:complete len:655 (+),score=171.97 TRINITY_DN2412_c0_g1_i2:418-2382(+)